MAVIPLSLLFLVLGADPTPGAAEPEQAILPCESTPARVEFSPDAPNVPTQVCVTPGTSTVIRFHTRIDALSVDLQGRDYFEITSAPGSILLIPAANIPIGQTFHLTVTFPDGAAPRTGTFNLVANPVVATRQLDVYRRARTVEAFQQDALRARDEAQRLQSRLAEKEATCTVNGGLAGLLLSGLLSADGLGGSGFLAAPKGWSKQVLVLLYRLPGKRLAVDIAFPTEFYAGLEVKNAVLTDNLGMPVTRVAFWAGDGGAREPGARVIAEWEVDKRQEKRTFTLQFAINNGQELRFENIRFP
ncbi:MAG TPA: DUF2381 family protein [Hyalangium sp.]|jgi:uncharacterized protein (TIGR02268 family)|nr:DUF2381 family protein [Hyalangium sp.]